MITPDPVDFFERQFQHQIAQTDFALNPFEQLALPHAAGNVLDLGCGLGNLSLEAARRGCSVTAIDASATAVERLRVAAVQQRLRITALQADLGSFRIEHDYDTIIAIGLLMFFRRERALALLQQIGQRVRPGGRAIVNVLIEGTTFLGMFRPRRLLSVRRTRTGAGFPRLDPARGQARLLPRSGCDTQGVRHGNRAESAQPGLNGDCAIVYFFSLPMKCLRNLATLGCTTIMQ